MMVRHGTYVHTFRHACIIAAVPISHLPPTDRSIHCHPTIAFPFIPRCDSTKVAVPELDGCVMSRLHLRMLHFNQAKRNQTQ
jgi:hypothetical protein